MKWFRAATVLTVVGGLALGSLSAMAEEPQPGASDSSVEAPTGPLAVGAKITVKKPVSIARLAASPAKFAGRTVRLEGTVKAVCQGMGCWVEVEAGGASFMARSLDESVLLPKDCKGRQIVVQGVVKALPRAAAEEAAPKDHVCPKPKYVVATQGAELK